MTAHHVLVTGGAGFIGTRLAAQLLAGGHRVRVLDSLSPQVHGALPRGLDWLADGAGGVEFRRGSVLDRAAVTAALRDVDTVVHLAAETGTGQSMYEVARYNEVNAQGTAVLLDVLAQDADRSVRRIVLASSRSVYGEGAYVGADGARLTPEPRTPDALARHEWEPRDPAGRPLRAVATREDDAIRPASIYAATKFAQEQLVQVAGAALGIDAVVLRLQNVYGEGQSLNNPYTGILSIFSTRVRRGLPLPIFEDGRESRDFVHVDDVAAAFVRAVEAPGAARGGYNVGSGAPTSVAEVAERLACALGRAPDVVITAQYRVGDVRHCWADVSRAAAGLGWAPAVRLDDGLARFAAWAASEPLPEDRLEAANRELRARRLMG